MYIVAFMVKQTFIYSWNSFHGDKKIRRFAEGIITDVRRSEGSLVPVSDHVLFVEAQRTFDPHKYVEVVIHDEPYARSSIKVTGIAVVPKDTKAFYELGGICIPVPEGTKLYQIQGLFGRKRFVTNSGVKVRLRKNTGSLSVLAV